MRTAKVQANADPRSLVRTYAVLLCKLPAKGIDVAPLKGQACALKIAGKSYI